jgi:hypothetical protein
VPRERVTKMEPNGSFALLGRPVACGSTCDDLVTGSASLKQRIRAQSYSPLGKGAPAAHIASKPTRQGFLRARRLLQVQGANRRARTGVQQCVRMSC